jgi:hypothetical protein
MNAVTAGEGVTSFAANEFGGDSTTSQSRRFQSALRAFCGNSRIEEL